MQNVPEAENMRRDRNSQGISKKSKSNSQVLPPQAKIKKNKIAKILKDFLKKPTVEKEGEGGGGLCKNFKSNSQVLASQAKKNRINKFAQILKDFPRTVAAPAPAAIAVAAVLVLQLP